MIIAVKSPGLGPPRYRYLFAAEPEPGLPAVPHGDEGFATGLQYPFQFNQRFLLMLFAFYVVVGSYRDSPVKGLVRIGEVADVSQRQMYGKIEFPGVFAGEPQHPGGKINAIQVKALVEGQEVGAVSTANIEQSTSLPPLCQCFQLVAEYGPVPEVIPAWGYLVEYISGC